MGHSQRRVANTLGLKHLENGLHAVAGSGNHDIVWTVDCGDRDFMSAGRGDFRHFCFACKDDGHGAIARQRLHEPPAFRDELQPVLSS